MATLAQVFVVSAHLVVAASATHCSATGTCAGENDDMTSLMQLKQIVKRSPEKQAGREGTCILKTTIECSEEPCPATVCPDPFGMLCMPEPTGLTCEESGDDPMGVFSPRFCQCPVGQCYNTESGACELVADEQEAPLQSIAPFVVHTRDAVQPLSRVETPHDEQEAPLQSSAPVVAHTRDEVQPLSKVETPHAQQETPLEPIAPIAPITRIAPSEQLQPMEEAPRPKPTGGSLKTTHEVTEHCCFVFVLPDEVLQCCSEHCGNIECRKECLEQCHGY